MAGLQGRGTLTEGRRIISREIQSSTMWIGDKKSSGQRNRLHTSTTLAHCPEEIHSNPTQGKFHEITEQEHPEANGNTFQEKHPMNQTLNNTDLRNVNKN